MPANTAGGWPYPLPTEPVKDGAVAIQNIANESQKRLGDASVFAIEAVFLFDSNGLCYTNWSTYGITWAARPVTTASSANTVIGANGGVDVGLYQPNNSATVLVLTAHYVSNGANFTGNITVDVISVGRRV